uniref:non-specific serine/threonine protein kinase n=1 Tax=Terrapene triunguis TaxID=2587831 RepID=A0A674JCM1_9SAUR
MSRVSRERLDSESCSRALSQARMYLEQIRSRVSPGGPDVHGAGKRDYLVDAAKQIRLALERDVSEDYEEAFNHYKNGVDVLLSGVQVDPNKERREAVKRKITQYLKRAEEIFNCHLQRTLGNGSSTATGYSSLRFRPIRTLSSAVENLRRCKVVGVIEKVQLVQDPATGGTFILKSLPKSHVETRERQTIIPHGVPFMAKLLRYYVSEDSIFLHLEHVQGECERQDSAPFLPYPLSLLASAPERGRDASGQVEAYKFPPSVMISSPCGGNSPELAKDQWDVRDCAGLPTDGKLGCNLTNKVAELLRSISRAREGAGHGQHREHPTAGQRGPPTHCSFLGDGQGTWDVNEELIRLWAAEMLLALEGLHQQGVLCRDLNPRNLLLDGAGHIRLTFFGQWTEVEPQCCSQALEDMYSAPEVGGISELTEACDWWSFGSLLYELLTGTSLSQSHPSGIHPHTQLHLPERLSLPATSLLTELLQFDPKRRLGSGGGGVNKLKSHPFFSTIQWNKLVG